MASVRQAGAQRFSSPTGCLILAQGLVLGVALGNEYKHPRRLKVCFIERVNTEPMRQAFSLRFNQPSLPRALPWASMIEPFGLGLCETFGVACVDFVIRMMIGLECLKNLEWV